MKTRIYKIDAQSESTGEIRLVKATSASQALRFAAGKKFIVRRATTEDVADLVSNGVKVETAAEQAAQ